VIGRIRALLVVAGGAVAVLALGILAGGPSASAQGACVQFDITGTWSTHQANNYDPTFSFTQSGTTLSGSATLPGNQLANAGYSGSGSVSGSLAGTSLDVTVVWPKADGSSVSGHYTATIAATGTTGQGQLNGGMAGSLAWTGGGPATCVKTAEPALGETSRAVPPAGGSVTATSTGSVSSTARKLDSSVTSSSGTLADTTVVADAKAELRTKIGEAVAACWLIGTDALEIPAHFANGERLAKIDANFQKLDAKTRLFACMGLVSVIYRTRGSGAGAAATGCRATRLELRVRRDRGGHVTSVRIRRRAPGKRDVRYSCTATGAGRINVKADGRRRGGLRRGVGKKLRLGAARAPGAAADSGRLTFRFGI
jgi:hypothetical protein